MKFLYLLGSLLLLALLSNTVSATNNTTCPGIPSNSNVFILLQNNSLIWFPPGTTNFRAVRINGVNGQLRGIDVRPHGNTLWGLSDTQELYQIDFQNGIATPISALSVSLPGANIGIDFNPAADRLRLVSGVNNLRTNVNNGATLVDTNLQYALGDVNQGRTPQLIGIAYNNNLDGVSSTTLYGLDSVNENSLILVVIDPPNNGTLHTIGAVNIRGGGLLGGFDIFTTPSCNTAVFATSGRFWFIDLASGKPSLVWTNTSGWLLEYLCNLTVLGLAIL